MQLLSAVFSAASLTIPPIMRTASIFIPAFVDPTLTDEQTISVSVRASGIERRKRLSPSVVPFWTSALYPPMKFIPTACAALSIAFAARTKSSLFVSEAPAIAMGVTETRLFIIGIPYVFSISLQTGTSLSAVFVILS